MKREATKENCWEFMKCGKEPGGARAGELGVCAAATEARLDGVHGGMNAGRACWVVAGTLCGGQVQGWFAQKAGDCLKCEFFRKVHKEEWPHYTISTALLRRLG